MFIRVFLILLFIFSFSFSSEIHWFSFEEGLKKAKEENKLVLVDIYAQWCHWCNVIENTTYRDKRVIKVIKKYFIPVRVDAEKRPDINKRYNQGGLPTTVILYPDGSIIWGYSRYISPDRMMKLLSYFASLDKKQIIKLVEKNKLRQERFLKRFEKKLKEKEISKAFIEKTFRYIKIRFDEEYGGFKGAPKFPIDDLPYFLILYSLFNDENTINMLEKTLDGYEQIIDRVEGGIFRYSTTQYWSYPHYEKLLKDQADISVLFFNVYSYTGRRRYLRDALLLVDFVKNKLYEPDYVFFFNSQGADIVDDEETILMSGEDFFPRDKEERDTIVSILGYSPKIEKSVYFSNNALAVKSFLYAYSYTGKDEYKNIALKVLKNIIDKGLTDKGVIYSPDIKKFFLNTQVYFLEALLTAYQTTGEEKYLTLGERLVSILNRYYFSKKTGVYTDMNDAGIGFKRISFIDNLLKLNYRLAKSLYKLYLFTGKDKCKKRANSLIKKFPDKVNLDTALAYYLYLYPPVGIHMISIGDKYLKEAFSIFPFWSFSHFLNRKSPYTESLGYKKDGIYLCNTDICFYKVKDIKNLRKKVFKIFKSYREMR